MRLRCVRSSRLVGWEGGNGWYSTQCAAPKDPPRLPLVPSHMLLLLCGRVHESSCCPYIPSGRGVARACMRRRVAAYSCAGIGAAVGEFGALGMAWHGMAEVTRDDGTAASAQGRESLGLEVWERKQRLGKVYALDETPNSRNCVRERVCAMG